MDYVYTYTHTHTSHTHTHMSHGSRVRVVIVSMKGEDVGRASIYWGLLYPRPYTQCSEPLNNSLGVTQPLNR